MALINLVLLLL